MRTTCKLPDGLRWESQMISRRRRSWWHDEYFSSKQSSQTLILDISGSIRRVVCIEISGRRRRSSKKICVCSKVNKGIWHRETLVILFSEQKGNSREVVLGDCFTCNDLNLPYLSPRSPMNIAMISVWGHEGQRPLWDEPEKLLSFNCKLWAQWFSHQPSFSHIIYTLIGRPMVFVSKSRDYHTTMEYNAHSFVVIARFLARLSLCTIHGYRECRRTIKLPSAS